MSGLLKLIDELLAVLERGLPCVVCSIAATRGSTPQKPGAMMLVFADGSQAGTLGGGCVESEVKKRALLLLTENASNAQVFSFQLDNDYGWDDGLICGGQMTVVVDRLTPQHRAYFCTFRDQLASGQSFVENIAVEDRPDVIAGSRAIADESGLRINGLGSDFSCQVPEKRGKPCLRNQIAIIPTRARITLLIAGAGHVGQAVAKLAAELDFDVWVVDDRDSFANASRFPHANRVIVGDIGRSLQELRREINPATYCLIVTRGHDHDEEALYQVIDTPAGYIGMIGSKRKVRLIMDDLRVKGISDANINRVRAPIGIDIGSQTVPEISVSICAELVAYRNLGAMPNALSFKDRI